MIKKEIIFFSYVFLVVIVLFICAMNPVAFQKSNAIVESSQYPELSIQHTVLDVAEFIRGIPYKKDAGMVYSVDPEKKYRKTVVQGNGNCSNLAFGTAYYLWKSGIEYQIIHLLPKEGFLYGRGHTVIRAPYIINKKPRIGIIDVFAGGIPINNEKFLDVMDLANAALRGTKIVSFSNTKDNGSPYYGEYLKDVKLGIIYSQEVERYFRFILSVYIDVGNERIEKLIFDGLSLILGLYPNIYVDGIDDLFSDHYYERWLYVFSLWLMRSSFFILPLVILYRCFYHKRR